MDDEVKASLKRAILRSLPILREVAPGCEESYLFWTKDAAMGWHGVTRPRTSLRHVFMTADNQLREVASEFNNLFFRAFPEYGPEKLTWIPGLAGEQLGRQPGIILERALAHLWKQTESFEWTDSAIDQVVADFEAFVQNATVQVRFQAQLINFQMPASYLPLPETVVIRKMSEQEVSAFNGGSGMELTQQPWNFGINEFTIEADYLARRFKGEEKAGEKDVLAPQQTQTTLFGKAVLALRTFKEGPVGYNWVHYKFVRFCPMTLPSYGSIDRYVKPGMYALTEEEVPLLAEHATRIFALEEPALEAACARLADAEARLRPQDQVLDAVIGMEALLLAGLGSDDRRGELKFRFSMNYATLFNSPEERLRAYKMAKDLYDHRSMIAHGGNVAGQLLRVGDERLSLHATAQRATNVLRGLIKRFLPLAQSAPYKKREFWERAYFRMDNSDAR